MSAICRVGNEGGVTTRRPPRTHRRRRTGDLHVRGALAIRLLLRHKTAHPHEQTLKHMYLRGGGKSHMASTVPNPQTHLGAPAGCLRFSGTLARRLLPLRHKAAHPYEQTLKHMHLRWGVGSHTWHPLFQTHKHTSARLRAASASAARLREASSCETGDTRTQTQSHISGVRCTARAKQTRSQLIRWRWGGCRAN